MSIKTIVKNAIAKVLGGPGSGNFDHEGRPGEVGGSGPGGNSSAPGIKESKISRLMDLVGKKGGFSYQPFFKSSPRDGYMVSPYKDREKVIAAPGLKLSNLRDYVEKNSDLFQKEDHFFGAWKDGDQVYLDVSVHHAEKEPALAFAKAHSQLAIFDVKNLESIYVDQKGDTPNA